MDDGRSAAKTSHGRWRLDFLWSLSYNFSVQQGQILRQQISQVIPAKKTQKWNHPKFLSLPPRTSLKPELKPAPIAVSNEAASANAALSSSCCELHWHLLRDPGPIQDTVDNGFITQVLSISSALAVDTLPSLLLLLLLRYSPLVPAINASLCQCKKLHFRGFADCHLARCKIRSFLIYPER